MIPQRPWSIVETGESVLICGQQDGNGFRVGFGPMDRDVAELIVRLVNAESEIVSALKAADRVIAVAVEVPTTCTPDNLALIRNALAKLRQ